MYIQRLCGSNDEHSEYNYKTNLGSPMLAWPSYRCLDLPAVVLLPEQLSEITSYCYRTTSHCPDKNCKQSSSSTSDYLY